MVDGRRRLRRTGQAWFLAACWGGVFGVISIAVLASPSERDPLAVVFYGVLLVGSVVLTIRTIRVEIRIEDDELLLRGILRTRRVPWPEVQSASVVSMLPYRVEVELRDGKVVRVDGIANLTIRRAPETLPVGEMAEAINAKVASSQRQPS